MIKTDKEIMQDKWSRAADKAQTRAEEDRVWAMAEVHNGAVEALEQARETVRTLEVIMKTAHSKIIHGVDNTIRTQPSNCLADDGVQTQTTAHDVGSCKNFLDDAMTDLENALWTLDDLQQKHKPHLTGQEKINQSFKEIA